MDLSTPSEPNIIGAFETEGSARDVAVSGSLVFVLVRGANEGRVAVLRESP